MTSVLYVIAGMWAIGVLGALIFLVVECCEGWAGRAMVVLLGVPVALLLGVGPLAGVAHMTGPDLATLLKSEWHCSASHVESTTTYVQSGKVMIPVTTETNVCDQYNRGGEQ